MYFYLFIFFSVSAVLCVYVTQLLLLLLLLLHGLYRTLSHSQSEESQVQGGHKSVSENPAVKFSL